MMMMTTTVNNPSESTASKGVGKLRMLSDRARFSVLIALLRNGPQCVSKLQTVVGMEQSLLSHHLRSLRMLGLVSWERRGRQIIYAPAESISIEKHTNTIHLGWCSLVIPKSSLW